MGVGDSHHKDAEAHQREAQRQFSQEELTQLEVTFRNLSENHQHFSREHFKTFCSRLLPGYWSEILYDQISRLESDHNGHATFICAMAKLLKGSMEDFALITSALMKKSTCEQTISLLAETYLRVQTGSTSFPVSESPSDSQILSNYLLADYQQFCDSGGQGAKYPIERKSDAEVLQKWFDVNLLVPKLLQTVFCSLFLPTLPDIPRMPKYLEQVKGFRSLLSTPAVLALTNQLPLEYQSEWKLLYTTQTMGESFATFTSSILSKGPTLMVIKDEDGHIFGGFCSTSWSLNPTFFGDDRTFIFTLAPEIRLFTPTGHNRNFCYLNDHQETLPNGLGFGGRIESNQQRCHYFSLWIDKTFEWGKSQSNCATFNSPQLSNSEKFHWTSVEVWQVHPDHKAVVEKVSTSILDSDPEAKAILTLSGKGQHSDGLRESDSQAQSPEDHRRID